MLVDQETYERLTREMETLMQKADEQDLAVGSAVKMVYTEEFSQTYNIGRYGRMTLKEGKRVFHAGSRHIDDEPMFEYTSMDYSDLGYKFRDGAALNINKEQMVSDQEWPKPLRSVKKWGLSSIEEKLFKQLGNVITLVNPSFKTMQVLDSMSSQAVQGLVHLTNTFDSGYIKSVVDFVSKSTWLAMTKEVRGVAYLGSGQPNFFPPTPWVRLIPSPYLLPCSQFQKYTSFWTERGYSSTYERKPGYYVNNSLQFDSSMYTYNPETVDETFKDTRRPSHMAFLESSIPLKMVDKDERRVYHKPKFVTIPQDAEWREVSGLLLRVKDREVFDVKGEGTYFSRRARTILPLMYNWTPFRSHGSHWLTLSSLRPRKDYNISVEHIGSSTFVCFGQTKPVVVERVFSNQRVWIDEGEVPTTLRGASNLKELTGKENGFQEWFSGDKPQGEIRSEFWRDRYGQIYPKELRKDDALAWLHQLDCVPNIQSENAEPDLKTLPRFVGRTGISYVDVSMLRPGTYYLCPTRSYLVQMIPQAAKYYSRNFLNIFTYSPYAKSLELDGEEYQSKLDPEWNNIITHFKNVVVTDRANNARTEIAVAEALGISVSIVARYVRLHPDMRLWKTGVEGLAQWVHKDSNRIRFPDGDDLSGRYWEDVIASGHQFTTKYDIQSFHHYCINNGYGIDYSKVGLHEITFRVKKRK